MKKRKVVKEQYLKARDIITSKIPLSQFIADNKLDSKVKNNFICCPIHGEDTPSLSFSDDLKTYHCFGCGAKGTVIELNKELKLKENEGHTYGNLKSMYDLAKSYNVELPNMYEYEEERVSKFATKSTRKKGTERPDEFYIEKIYKQSDLYIVLSDEERKEISVRVDNYILGISDENIKDLYRDIQKRVNEVRNEEILRYYQQNK